MFLGGQVVRVHWVGVAVVAVSWSAWCFGAIALNFNLLDRTWLVAVAVRMGMGMRLGMAMAMSMSQLCPRISVGNARGDGSRERTMIEPSVPVHHAVNAVLVLGTLAFVRGCEGCHRRDGHVAVGTGVPGV